MRPLFPAHATAALCLIAAACGQEPSFHDTTTVAPRRSSGGEVQRNNGDALPKRDPNGQDSTAGDRDDHDAVTAVPPENGGTDGVAAQGAGDRGGSVQDANAAPDGATAMPPQPATPQGGEDGLGLPTTPGKHGSEGVLATPKRVTRAMTFAAQAIGAASVTKRLGDAYVTSDFALVRAYPDRVESLTQTTRSAAVDRFEQGNSGALETQTFDQVADRPLDIVVVIDDSGSMAEEQQNMASKLAPLLTYVNNSDWQIGVVTTDPDEGCLRKLIKKTDANPGAAFQAAVTAGVTHSGNERGVLQAVRTLAGTCLTEPWIRKDSTVAVLIVSDEDNCSANGGDCAGKDYNRASYLYDYLASIREPGKNARVYGLIWHPTQTHAQCSTGGNVGTQYADLIASTSGTWGSICASDYSATLAQMSSDMRAVLNSKFTLAYAPDPASVRVTVGADEVHAGIQVTGKVVEISPPPPAGAKVTVSYRHDAVPLKTSFALRFAPAAGTVGVTVDDQPAPRDTYAVNLAAATVDFAAPPAEYAKIAVTYRRGDEALPRSFAVQGAVKPGTLTATVDGAAVAEFTFAHGSVTFATAPADGAPIEFAYKAIGDPVLSYPFVPAHDHLAGLEVYDAATGDAVAAAFAAGSVVIAAAAFAEGRVLTIRYDNEARQAFRVELPNVPLGDVKVTGGDRVCAGAPHVAVAGKEVAADGCGFGESVAEVRVDYRYIVENRRSFTFEGDRLPGVGDVQQWSVWVDDAERDDFKRDGATISFDQDLPLGAVVKIQLMREER